MEAFTSKTIKEYRKLLHATGWEVIDKTEGLLCHYTSASAFLSILKDRKLWFTDYRFLNDSSEGFFFFFIIRELLKSGSYNWKLSKTIVDKIEKDILIRKLDFNSIEGSYFVCSFSESSDSLTMWNYYTKNPNLAGYNLVFDKRGLLNSIVKTNFFDKYDFSIIRVIYNKDQQILCIKRILDFFNLVWEKSKGARRELLIEEFFYLMDTISLGFKHVAYQDEHEIRIVLKISKQIYRELLCDDVSSETRINLRSVNNMIVPYIELNIDISSLLKIITSPFIKDSLAISSVYGALYKHGITNCCVESSKIPARY